MRILMVSEDVPNRHLGGLGKHALALARELARRGHSVDFLGNATNDFDTGDEQRGPGRFFSELRGYECGWKQQALGAYHSAALMLNARPLVEAIRRHSPGYDVIHYHGHQPWIAALLPDELPFIQTRHDQGGDCMLRTRFLPGRGRCAEQDERSCARCGAGAEPNPAQRWLSAGAVRRMRRMTLSGYRRHRTIFVSGFLQRQFERLTGSEVPGVVIHNAVDVDALKLTVLSSGHRSGGGGALRLFSAGAMFEYKGFGPLLEALAKFESSTVRPLRLRIAGAGPLENELRARHESTAVAFLGWTPYRQVLEEVLAADAVLVPSVWDEPCATTILEALALGRTVYALKSGGTPEMLAYAETAGGRLMLFDDVTTLMAAALRHVPLDATLTSVRPESFAGNLSAMTDAVEREYLAMTSSRSTLPLP